MLVTQLPCLSRSRPHAGGETTVSIAIVVLPSLNRAWFLWPHELQHSRLPCPHCLSEFAQTYVPLVGDAIQPPPLLSPSPPACNLFQNQGFSDESVLHIRWPKYWSFSFSISLSNEYYELISFSIDQFDLPAVQGTLKSLLQHHSSKASILGYSACFIVQLTSIHDYWKNHSFDYTELCHQNDVSAF